MSNTVTHHQRAGLPVRVVNVLELRQGSRTDRVPARRRQDPRVRGGRQGLRNQVRNQMWEN